MLITKQGIYREIPENKLPEFKAIGFTPVTKESVNPPKEGTPKKEASNPKKGTPKKGA